MEKGLTERVLVVEKRQIHFSFSCLNIVQCTCSIGMVNYSQTSDSGPSEIGTQYNKPLYKGRFSRSQIIMVLIHFEPPRRGQPLYKGQKT